MTRRSLREVALERQRTLFGVDRMERVLGDVIVELIRVSQQCETLDVSRETPLPNSVHMLRLKGWLVQYTEMQRSEFELGEPPEPAPVKGKGEL